MKLIQGVNLIETIELIKKMLIKKLGLIQCSVHGLDWLDSGCLKDEAAITAPRCSQLQEGRRSPAA